MIKGGSNTGSLSSQAHGIRVNNSIYGKAVNLIYGLTTTAPDLIWYNDWRSQGSPVNEALAVVTGQSSGGKKSGKGEKKGFAPKYYSAAVDFLFGHAPLIGVLTIWYNNLKIQVTMSSMSGTISGGQFTFTPHGGSSRVTSNYTIAPSYTFAATSFVADYGVRVTGTDNVFQPANPAGVPGPGQYTVDNTGLYTFNPANAGTAMDIIYYTTSTSGRTTGLNAGVIACTLHETFTETFNDFGGPGSVTVYGTWARPLWNKAFAVPGHIGFDAHSARDPYSFSAAGNTLSFPAELEGLPVTAYFGVPTIYKADGTFYSSSLTPLTLLNLEFERVLGSGAEYANHADQRVIQNWASGAGSTQFDLGMQNAIPNINFEVIGAFTQWPNGDCDVADIITDIIYSGPVLV